MALTTVTANGTVTVSDLVPGGRYVAHAAGTYGGGTMTIKWSDGTNDTAFPSGELTASGALEIIVPLSTVKFVLSGATNPSIIVGITPVTQRT